ncbi:MAG: hypothetical protein AB1403_08340 [Candidatus Riflebacteria bacterium]
MNGKLHLNRKGALMLMLLVVIVIGGIVALRMLPQEDVIAKREKEENLHKNLSQIREAFDLKWQADENWTPDLTNKAGIRAALQTLANEGFLREEDILDPTVPTYLWDTSDIYYWKASTNIASNTSFELEDPSDPTLIASWTKAPDTEAATVTQYLDDNILDDYPHQNKLGAPLQGGGTSLMIVK